MIAADADHHDDDHRLAVALAAEAGAALLELRATAIDHGLGVWGLRDAGDLTSHDLLVARLAEHRPGDVVFSEEGIDRGERLDRSRVWIIDPLDGTSDFADPYSSEWAVQVALVDRGEPVAAAVALPMLDTVLATKPAPQLPGRPEGRPFRLVVSRRGYMSYGRYLAAELDAEITACGSVGVKVWAVVAGEVDAYVHAAPLPEWDTCAPQAVAEAAGLWVSDLLGNRISYNQPDARANGLVVCRPEMHTRILDAVAG